MTSRKAGTLAVIAAVLGYVAADVAMDVMLFPRLPEPLREHHRAVVTRHAVFFGLLPVWILGAILSEKRQKRVPLLIFGSAIAATVVHAFTSLPFLWVASTVPALSRPLLFLHDHGVYVYFGLLLFVLVLRQLAGRRTGERAGGAQDEV